MQFSVSSIFNATTATGAARFLGAVSPEALCPAVLDNVHQAIAAVDTDAADIFYNQGRALLGDQDLDSETARTAHASLMDVVGGLQDRWPKVRTFWKKSQRDVRDRITKIIRRKSGDRPMPQELRYLSKLLDEAQIFGLLPNVLKIVEMARQKPDVVTLEDDGSTLKVPRSTEDYLGLIVTYLLLEDYERILHSLDRSGISMQLVLNSYLRLEGPLEAKRKMLAGELDVVVHATPAEFPTQAVYHAPLATLFLDPLPLFGEIDAFPNGDNSDNELPPAGTIVGELSEIAWPKGEEEAPYSERLFHHQFLGTLYMVLRKEGDSLAEDMERVREEELQNLRIAFEMISENWPREVLEYFQGQMRTLQPLFFLMVEKWSDSLQDPALAPDFDTAFDELRSHYYSMQEALHLLNALQGGVGDVDSRTYFLQVPLLRLEERQLKISWLPDRTYKQTVSILLQRNQETIQTLIDQPRFYHITHEDAEALRAQWHLYAVLAQRALDEENGEECQCILEEYLIPLIHFVTHREY